MTVIEKNILAGVAVGFVAGRCRRAGNPAAAPTPASYGEPEYDERLLPLSFRNAMAPEVPRLKCRIRLDDERGEAWRWKNHLAFDDQIECVSDRAEAGDRDALFSGFVLDVDWQFGDGDADCVATAAGRSFRLARDVQVYGRYAWSAGDEVRFFGGLPCEFNAGGLPNRSPTERSDATFDVVPVPVFCADGQEDALYWTLPYAVAYLCHHYNAAATWIANPDLSAAAWGDRAPIVASCDGVSLWEALARVAAAAGYDVWEEFGLTNGRVSSTIRVQHRTAGTLRTVRHQAVPGGGVAAIDIRQTNLFAASIAESVASCVPAPVILGARPVYEATIELGKAWEPTALGDIGAADWDYDAEYRLPLPGASAANYAVPLAEACRNVGRMWDANTDGDYDTIAFIDRQDPAAAVNAAWAGRWPEMAYAPVRLPQRTYAGGALLEWSTDGGTTWEVFPGAYRLMPDRLGVYLTQARLWDVRPKSAGEGPSPTGNLFYLLCKSGESVKLRLTCGIASPHRCRFVAARSPMSGTPFAASAVYDRGSQAHTDTIARARQKLPSDDGDAALRSADLQPVAEAVCAAAADRSIEASLSIPWPETGVSLGDRIARIQGIEYPLAVNSGASRRYPRVVAVEMHLATDTYDTQLVLDTYRKAGVV